MQEFLGRLNMETEVLLALSIILFSGFILTRLTNTLNMPKVSGYILAGILIGPCCLDFIPPHITEAMGFVSDLALAFIAFGVGKFFKKEVLMQTGRRIILITVSEAMTAGILVTFLLKLMFGLDWGFALILGAIATATAPASTMMTINQYKAKGEFVNTLLQIVALDDVVCLLAFSVVSAVVNGSESGTLSWNDVMIPVFYNFLAIGLGVFCGYFLSRLLVPARSRDNRLILAIAMLLGLSGICAAVDISPLLSCMVFGAVYINLTRDKKLFRQINNFTPPVMSIFFIVSGMNLDLTALKTVGAIGVAYFMIRIVGKYLGTYISCLLTGTSREIRNYMGFALIPQAGVAIGLAFLGQRMLPPETGNLMLTIILSSSVLYEMVGPVSAKAALFLSGSIPREGVVENGERAEEPTVPEENVNLQTAEACGEAEPEAHEAERGSGEAEPEAGKPKAGSRRAEKAQPKSRDTVEAESGSRKAAEPGRKAGKQGRRETGKRNQRNEKRGREAKPTAWEPESGSREADPAILESEAESRKAKPKSQNADFKGRGFKTETGTPVKTMAENPESEPGAQGALAEVESGEAYVAVLPGLFEYSEGVDERDDYDVESAEKPTKTKKKKKIKEKVKKGK